MTIFTACDRITPMNRLSLISAIIQAISGLVLIGLSVYYYTLDEMTKFAVFAAVGVIFIILPARTFYKRYKSRKEEEKKNAEEHGKHGFL